jgi:hypothetical protein
VAGAHAAPRHQRLRMTDDAVTPDLATSQASAPIDIEALLACMPDEASEGLSRDAIRQSYAEQRPSFRDEDFDDALQSLVGGSVRTTTRRLWGVSVPLYRRSH